jgi:adenine-specific DNA-methyltransferase
VPKSIKCYSFRTKTANDIRGQIVMNSLLHYEGLGGQVQMIYMDPPYGLK